MLVFSLEVVGNPSSSSLTKAAAKAVEPGKENVASSGWKAKHAALRKKLQIDEHAARWSDQHEIRGLTMRQARPRDVIDLCYQALCRESMTSKDKDSAFRAYVDVSQDVGRKSWSTTGWPCLTRSSDMFAFERSRFITGFSLSV